jgi:hypothetical protein
MLEKHRFLVNSGRKIASYSAGFTTATLAITTATKSSQKPGFDSPDWLAVRRYRDRWKPTPSLEPLALTVTKFVRILSSS